MNYLFGRSVCGSVRLTYRRSVGWLVSWSVGQTIGQLAGRDGDGDGDGDGGGGGGMRVPIAATGDAATANI